MAVETVDRERRVDTKYSSSEAIEMVESELRERYPIKRIRGAKTWRYTDGWEVKVIGVLE